MERLVQIRRHLPGPPSGAHVSADTAVVSQTQSSPVVSVRDVRVPPGSVEGASRVAQIMGFHIGYTLPCDRRDRVPYWVFEHLTRESSGRQGLQQGQVGTPGEVRGETDQAVQVCVRVYQLQVTS